MSKMDGAREVLEAAGIRIRSFQDAMRMRDYQEAMDRMGPPWWNGRRIHSWATAPRWVVIDEVGDFPEETP